MFKRERGQTEEAVPPGVDIDAVCKALADPIRRSLLKALGEKLHFCHLDGEEVNGVCVQDLSELLNLPQSTVSRHLAVLRQASLVGHQQKGVWHYYYCRIDTMEFVRQWFESLIPGPLGGGAGRS